MSDILKNNFEKYLWKQYGSTIESLVRGFAKFNIDYFLIGALSRDLWLSHIESLPPYRLTTDIDFAILVNDDNQYIEIMQYLINSEGFREDPEPYRVHSPSGVIVDLIPFGKIEKNNEVRIKGKKWTYLTVMGTKEVTDWAVKLDDTFGVITLPGLCILKLIAWQDNPGEREKDVIDFRYLLYNYFSIAGDEIFNDQENDWISDNFEEKTTGARYLSWQMNKILDQKNDLKSTVISALTKQLDKFSEEEIDKMYRVNKNDYQIVVYKLITVILKSITID
jgi:predicted nucleotidyltransferase